MNVQTVNANFNIRENGSKDDVLGNMVTLSQYIQRLGVLIDIDDQSVSDARQRVIEKLRGNFSNVSIQSDTKVVVEDRTIIVIGCSGLDDDEDLNDFGIYRNAIEDHLLKILLTDDETVNRLSNTTITTSSQLSEALYGHQELIEDYTEEVSRSKLLYRLSSILLRYDGNIDSFSNVLLHCSGIDMESHESTSDLISFLNQVDPM